MNLDEWAGMIQEHGDSRYYFCFTNALGKVVCHEMDMGVTPSDLDVDVANESGLHHGIFMYVGA